MPAKRSTERASSRMCGPQSVAGFPPTRYRARGNDGYLRTTGYGGSAGRRHYLPVRPNMRARRLGGEAGDAGGTIELSVDGGAANATGQRTGTLPSAARMRSGVKGWANTLAPKGPQRVVDGVHDGRRSAGRAGLARALGAEQQLPRRRLDMADLDVGHLGRHRHQVVGHRADQQLALGRVGAVLVERAADALHDAAAHLLVDQQRIDDAPAILDAPMLQQRDDAGVDVDLEPAGLHAVGEGERIGLGDEVPGLHQLARQVGWQRVAAEVDDARKLGERHAHLARLALDDLAVDEIERVGLPPAAWRRPRPARPA